MLSVDEQARHDLETILSVPESSPNAILGMASRGLLLSATRLPQWPYLLPLPIHCLLLQPYSPAILGFSNNISCVRLHISTGAFTHGVVSWTWHAGLLPAHVLTNLPFTIKHATQESYAPAH